MPPTNAPKGSFTAKKFGGIKGKYWLIGGGVAAAGTYYYVKKSSAVAAAGSTPTTDPNIDPNTGVPYADEQAAAYQAATADGGYGGGNIGGGGFGGGTSGSGDAGVPINITVDTSTPVSTASETNRQWQEHAIAALEAHGYTHAMARLAIASYLAGLPISKKEEQAVMEAVKLIGPPPQNAPAVQTMPGSGKTTGGTTTSATTTGGRKGTFRGITSVDKGGVVKGMATALKPKPRPERKETRREERHETKRTERTERRRHQR